MAGKVTKHVARVLPPKRRPPVSKQEGLHAHRCPTCKERYEHTVGGDWDEDPECANCRYGTTWAIWRTNALPTRECCITTSRAATSEDVKTHRLGGRSTWWICDRCKRTHPYQPTRQEPQP